MADQDADLGTLWGVHSSKDDPRSGPRPEFRGWATSEAAAKLELQRIEQEDAAFKKADRYWVAPMTKQDEYDYRRMGLLPNDGPGT